MEPDVHGVITVKNFDVLRRLIWFCHDHCIQFSCSYEDGLQPPNLMWCLFIYDSHKFSQLKRVACRFYFWVEFHPIENLIEEILGSYPNWQFYDQYHFSTIILEHSKDVQTRFVLSMFSRPSLTLIRLVLA